MTAGTSACAAPGRLPLLLVCHTHGMPRRWHLRERRQTHWSSDLRHNRSMIACTGQVSEPLTFPHGDRPQKVRCVVQALQQQLFRVDSSTMLACPCSQIDRVRGCRRRCKHE